MSGSAYDIIRDINKKNGKGDYNTSCRHYCEIDNEPYCAIKMDMVFCTENCAYCEVLDNVKCSSK